VAAPSSAAKPTSETRLALGEALRPIGMAEEYWQELRKRVGNAGHGWIHGKLNL
jgi:hypothetical protein